MEYTIEFTNTTDGINKTVTNIASNFYCTSEYDDATSVVVWATHKGIQGIKSNETFVTLKPRSSTSSTTTPSSTTTQEGMKLFKISSTI